VGIIRQIPRSHIILLILIEEICSVREATIIEQDTLFKEYNKEASSMMIQRISFKEFEQLLDTLVGSSILSKKTVK
jgi:hypothetical protein